MNINNQVAVMNHERTVRVQNGWVMLVMLMAWLFADIALLVYSINDGLETVGHPYGWLLVPAIFLLVMWVILLMGFFTLQPNEARVLVLFGAYKGTVRTSGFHWGNPFYTNGPQQMGAAQGKRQ